MQILKGKSSAWIKKKIKHTHGLYERQSLWARGYFVRPSDLMKTYSEIRQTPVSSSRSWSALTLRKAC
jgi:hypothetical protein